MGIDERDGSGQRRADGGHGMIDDGRLQDWLTIKTELEHSISQTDFAL